VTLDIQLTIRLPKDVSDRLDQFVLLNPASSKSSTTAHALDLFLPNASTEKRRSTRAVPGAGQDQITGRAGRDFGVSAGRALCLELGELIDPVATELRLRDGRRATIRTARNRNTQWGCLDSVRGRVDVIICAYTKDDREFQLWEVTPEKWDRLARPASPGHKLHGKLTLVSKSKVEIVGTKLDNIVLAG
jgi:hypothetical protein